jgi:hypothetical protein
LLRVCLDLAFGLCVVFMFACARWASCLVRQAVSQQVEQTVTVIDLMGGGGTLWSSSQAQSD